MTQITCQQILAHQRFTCEATAKDLCQVLGFTPTSVHERPVVFEQERLVPIEMVSGSA